MAPSGSNSPELLIAVDRESGVGLRAQLETGLREAVRNGRLSRGARLPSSRALASDIGVTRRVVQDAYEQLVAEGYLSAKVGSGTIVNTIESSRSVHVPRPDKPNITFDLRPAHPDLRLFPRTQWNKASHAALATMANDDLGYTDPRGLEGLRRTVADYLARVRGLCGDGTDVMICDGFGHGLTTALDALRRSGLTSVAVEDPGYFGAREVIEHLGLTVCPVTVDGDGLDVEALTKTGAKAVVVTPAHQAPLGMVLAPERRLALARWARDCNGWIIEDDYDAEFRYDRNPIGAVQGLAPDRTIYIGTLSKCLAPGLRLGWIVAPDELFEQLKQIRSVTDRSTSTILQATLASFIEQGDLDRHIRRGRKEYQRRRDALVEALRVAVPEAELGQVAAGLHVPMTLPPGVDERDVTRRAQDAGVLVDSLAPFRVTDQVTPQTLVIGFGRVRPDEARAAAAALARSIHDC